MVTGEKKMKICVLGLWHLGSVTSAGLAKSGHTVVGLDFNNEVIKNLQNAHAPIDEPGLNELIHETLERKSLSFTNDPSVALPDADVLWIAFDTPVDEQDHSDISYIEKNFEKITPFIHDEMKIIISCQVPVGFTRNLQNQFNKKNPGKKVYFAYSPGKFEVRKSTKNFFGAR